MCGALEDGRVDLVDPKVLEMHPVFAGSLLGRLSDFADVPIQLIVRFPMTSQQTSAGRKLRL
jgi:hypothetical protein